jgi:hypothetical protein
MLLLSDISPGFYNLVLCIISKMSLVSDILILPMHIPPTSIKYSYIWLITPCIKP